MIAGDNGVLPRLRVLSRSRPSTPASAKRFCQWHTEGRLVSLRAATSSTARRSAERKNDVRPLHMLLRPVAIRYDSVKTRAVVGA
jgi:hypothetical protein